MQDQDFAGGRLLGAAGFNRPRDVRAAVCLIAAGAHPEPAALRDDATDLRELARAAERQLGPAPGMTPPGAAHRRRAPPSGPGTTR